MPNDYDDPSWPRSRTADDAPRRARSSEPSDLAYPERERRIGPGAWLVLGLFLLLMFGLVAAIVVRVEAVPTTAPPFPMRKDMQKDWPPPGEKPNW